MEDPPQTPVAYHVIPCCRKVAGRTQNSQGLAVRYGGTILLQNRTRSAGYEPPEAITVTIPFILGHRKLNSLSSAMYQANGRLRSWACVDEMNGLDAAPKSRCLIRQSPQDHMPF